MSEIARQVAENPNLTDQQRLALAELHGNDVRSVKRGVFWTADILLGGPVAGAIASVPGIIAEAQWNKITSDTANKIHAEDPENQLANDVRAERTARRTSRVVATSLVTVAPIAIAKAALGTAVAVSAGALTITASPILAPVLGVVAAAELAWVGVKTVENVYNRRATRAARQVLGR